MIYRILTENKNRGRIEAFVCATFDGATIFEAVGIWEGTREKSLVIEIDGQKEDRNRVLGLARVIKDYNEQQAVLVQEIKSASTLV